MFSGDSPKALGKWVNRQRTTYGDGKFEKEGKDRLDEIGLIWSVGRTTARDTMYDTLCHYATERKALDPDDRWDGNVPQSYKTSGDSPMALGIWVNTQNSAYGNGTLEKERKDRLDEIGL
jgi:hypothetical protein